MDHATIEVWGSFELDSLLVALIQRRERLIGEGTDADLREASVLSPLIRRVERERDTAFEEGRR